MHRTPCVRARNRWFMHRTRLFARRTGGLLTEHGRSLHEQVVCSPHTAVRTGPCAVHKPLVHRTNGRVRCLNHMFVERTAVCGTQTTCSSNERPRAVPKLPVRRTNGRVRCINRLFVERTVVFGQQTAGSLCERPCAVHKPLVRLAHRPVR